MKLPKVSRGCVEAVTDRARQDVYLYGAEFMIRMLFEDRKEIVAMACDTAAIVFPDDLTKQARTVTAITLILSAINATLEGQELDEQFGLGD